MTAPKKINTAPAVAPAEDPKAHLVKSADVQLAAGAPIRREYSVDPAYFEEHLAEASKDSKNAFVIGNAVRVDH